MRISDWSSDVCSSDLAGATATASADAILDCARAEGLEVAWVLDTHPHADHFSAAVYCGEKLGAPRAIGEKVREVQKLRSEEHTSELQSLMRISYAVFCLKKQKKKEYESPVKHRRYTNNIDSHKSLLK